MDWSDLDYKINDFNLMLKSSLKEKFFGAFGSTPKSIKHSGVFPTPKIPGIEDSKSQVSWNVQDHTPHAGYSPRKLLHPFIPPQKIGQFYRYNHPTHIPTPNKSQVLSDDQHLKEFNEMKQKWGSTGLQMIHDERLGSGISLKDVEQKDSKVQLDPKKMPSIMEALLHHSLDSPNKLIYDYHYSYLPGENGGPGEHRVFITKKHDMEQTMRSLRNEVSSTIDKMRSAQLADPQRKQMISDLKNGARNNG